MNPKYFAILAIVCWLFSCTQEQQQNSTPASQEVSKECQAAGRRVNELRAQQVALYKRFTNLKDKDFLGIKNDARKIKDTKDFIDVTFKCNNLIAENEPTTLLCRVLIQQQERNEIETMWGLSTLSLDTVLAYKGRIDSVWNAVSVEKPIYKKLLR